MNKICDACETVAHCSKSGCIPVQPERVAIQKQIVVQLHGRHRIIDATLYFNGHTLEKITWEK